MPKGLAVALIIWAIFLTLLFVGIYGSTWKLGRRIRAAKSPGEVAFWWGVRCLYVVALPVVFVMVVLGAKFMWDDIRDMFRANR